MRDDVEAEGAALNCNGAGEKPSADFLASAKAIAAVTFNQRQHLFMALYDVHHNIHYLSAADC